MAILLKPVGTLVEMLFTIDAAYARKKNVQVSSLPLRPPRCNIVVFPKHTPSHAKPIGDWRCKRCSSNRFVVRKENRICVFCGESGYYEESSVHFSPAPVRIFNPNANKRITHFKNWIARLQGKERCSISRESLDAIDARIAMYPNTMSEYDRIKLAMRELGLQRYYGNVYYVMRQLLGYSLVEFRKINEARLLALFMRVQEPFTRTQNERTNMLSYQFLIRKFCELLGYKVAEYIPLLKSRANLQKQDMLWSRVCAELGLPFYPSV